MAEYFYERRYFYKTIRSYKIHCKTHFKICISKIRGKNYKEPAAYYVKIKTALVYFLLIQKYDETNKICGDYFLTMDDKANRGNVYI